MSNKLKCLNHDFYKIEKIYRINPVNLENLNKITVQTKVKNKEMSKQKTLLEENMGVIINPYVGIDFYGKNINFNMSQKEIRKITGENAPRIEIDNIMEEIRECRSGGGIVKNAYKSSRYSSCFIDYQD